jgi:dTDP-4-dehydrorhamnose reductase
MELLVKPNKCSMRVLVLGTTGMLGHMVVKYLRSKNITVDGAIGRWPNLKEPIKSYDGDYIINCIGAIPQRTDDFDINWNLPIWLDLHAPCKVIHPGTDCEIDNDKYGTSKRIASNFINCDGVQTKIIKTSIIGPELNGNSSLLEWFLSQDGEVYGYTKARWNGVTTLQWAKQCYSLISNWDDHNTETILFTDSTSKFELLNIIKNVFNKDIDIIKKQLGKDKCLDGDLYTGNIQEQLIELKDFYYDN